MPEPLAEPTAGYVTSILEAIGSTPLLQIEGVYAKLEYLNPSGSVKARIARYMIERAEAEGLLQPGDHDRGGLQRQHRQRDEHGGRGQGLPDAGGHARRDEPGAGGHLTRASAPR